VREVTFFLILCLLCVAPVMAQSPTATINGIVLDPSGSAIAGAQVVVVNEATGVQYTTKANGEGIYVVPNLPPGPYRIQVSNTGFKTIIKPDIVLHVQDALAINFTLPIGAASEVVTVQGGTPLINTQDAAVSTVIDREFVESLPLNGRSFNTLLQLTPGVVIAPANSSSGQFSIAGQRTDANNFTVDGVSANFGVIAAFSPGGSGTGTAQAFSALGGTSSLVSVDALQEFRVETSSFAPEFGRTPGGQVILTTRSGTNDFHGGIFDYFRNDVMDANDWFANQAGIARAPEHHNDFGGFLGGPLWRRRTFFFFSYEGARLDEPQTQSSQVPSEWARTVAASATLAPFLNAYPQPDDKALTPGVYTSAFTGTYANAANLNATSVRIDHSFNDQFSIFGRYNNAPSRIEGRGASATALSVLESTLTNTQTLTVGANMQFGRRATNTIHGNYSSQTSNLNFALTSFAGAVPLPPDAYLNSLSSSDTEFALGIAGSFLVTGPTGRNRVRQFNVLDDVSVALGAHQLKFGIDYRDIFLDVNPFHQRVQYNATSLQALVSTGQARTSTSTFRPSQIVTPSLSLYGQDIWRVNSRLTLTYGVRWEVNPAPSGRGSTSLLAWSNVNDPAAITLAPQGNPLWNTTYGNFAPRLGLAYSLTQNRDFVVRAGGGVFYDLGVGSASLLATDFPNGASGIPATVSVPVPDWTPYLPPPVSLQPPYPNGIYAFAPNLKLPRSYQWNVALEKSFGSKEVITATYVGQAGRDLLRQEALFQPNANFLGDFLLDQNNAWSNYNALQIQYRQPISTGLQVLVSYSWSHSLDNASNDVVAGLSNTVISAASDYASSDFDVRHSLSGALTYVIPPAVKSGPLAFFTRGWSADAVVVARSGFPLNAIVISESPDPGGSAVTRPDIVPGQPAWITNPAAPGGKNLNPNAFSVPSTARQGTEGRNDIKGFGLTQVDFSLAREFSLTEQLKLQFRTDAFNLFNHPNFANPAFPAIELGAPFLESLSMLNQSLGGLNPLFQQGGPRSLQLSLKLKF
jgi:hypothetical protein